MSFIKRQINLQFSGSNSVVNLQGLRCNAAIKQYGGLMTAAQLELRVWGMTLDQMNQYSSVGANTIALQGLQVSLFAGNVGGAIAQVFQGSISRAYIDFSGSPDVCFACSAQTALIDRATPSAPNSFPGSQNAETLIQALAKKAGYGFSNPNGAHAVIQNQYVSGSIISQIETIAKAAAIPMAIENNTVTIWPNTGTRDGVQINLGPNTGMVGYPTFNEVGFIVKSEFNPAIVVGRQINVTSVIPKANGLWPIQAVTHEISALMPDGPWFTTAALAASAYVAVN
jgi:hypothetical protein